MGFKKGDTVTWTSQSAGYVKTKTGIIIGVVPIGKPAHEYGYTTPHDGMPRNHESYIVKVGSKTYWPRVSQIK